MKDLDILRKQAHRLRGSSSTMGLVQLASTLSKIENAAKNGEQADYESMVTELERQLVIAKMALEEYGRSLPAG